MHEQQQLITLTEAAKHAPGRPSTNCVWRWCRKGVLSRTGQRIKLQHARIGGKIFTSLQWLAEFGERLASADADYFTPPSAVNQPAVSQPRHRSAQERQKAIERAERSLAEAGV